MKFLVHGSIAYDVLLGCDGSFVDALDPRSFDRLSVNYLSQRYVRHHGGTAANISWNLALLGHQAVAIGAVGVDGEEYLSLLRNHKIDVSFVMQSQTQTTATAIIATDSGERQISFFHPGADGEQTSLPESAFSSDIAYSIISPRNPLMLLLAARISQQKKIPYLFDPGQVVHAFSSSELLGALQGSAGLVVNEYEWELASKKLQWNESDAALTCGLLVKTLGDKGMELHTKNETVRIPACPVSRLVNPTGAGDAARAGLLVGLGSGWSLTQCGRLAAVMGSLVCGQEGTLLDSLGMHAVHERVKEVYGETLPS